MEDPITVKVDPWGPDCNREDCRIQIGSGSTTCAYYQPIYDKHGTNTNPDGNVTTSTANCLACGKSWGCSTKYGKTTWTEWGSSL